MALTWWQFQHNILGNLVDHPADVSKSEIAYVGSWMMQVDVALDGDVADANLAFRAFQAIFARGGDALLRDLVKSDQQFLEDNLGQDGMFDAFDVLRRDTFDGWWIDYGVLGVFLRDVVTPGGVGATVLDIGAGGGHYSTFLNRTGIVTAIAVDAAGKNGELERFTGGKVRFFDAQEPVMHFPQYDYLLCLEVAEHIHPEKTATFVRNLDVLGKRGLVLSWAHNESCGLGWGHVNCRATPDVIALIEGSTGYRVNVEITSRMREQSQVSWIGKTVLYFSKDTHKAEYQAQVVRSQTSLFSGSASIPSPATRCTSGNLFGPIESAVPYHLRSAPNPLEERSQADFDDYAGPEKSRLYGRHERNDEFERVKESLADAKVLLQKVVTGMDVPLRFQ